jgi:hypothetical protein
MLLIEGIRRECEEVDPIECERIIQCDRTMTPQMFHQVSGPHAAIFFCGHGPVVDGSSVLSLYRSEDGHLVYLRPSDIDESRWTGKVFVSTA